MVKSGSLKTGVAILFVAVIPLLAAGIFFYLKQATTQTKLRQVEDQLRFSGENKVKLKLSFIGCACGLDYPQYHVDSVLFTENDDYRYLVNKEISLSFRDSTVARRLKEPDCFSRCYYLLLSGNLESNGFGMHNLAVDSGEVVVDQSCCDAQR